MFNVSTLDRKATSAGHTGSQPVRVSAVTAATGRTGRARTYVQAVDPRQLVVGRRRFVPHLQSYGLGDGGSSGSATGVGSLVCYLTLSEASVRAKSARADRCHRDRGPRRQTGIGLGNLMHRSRTQISTTGHSIGCWAVGVRDRGGPVMAGRAWRAPIHHREGTDRPLWTTWLS